MAGFDLDVVVIGGCGHVGLPLAIAFADRVARMAIHDVSAAAVATVNAGRLPFAEPGAAETPENAIAADRLTALTNAAIVATAEHVIVVIGTPVHEHLNPDQVAITKALSGCAEYLRHRPDSHLAQHRISRGDRAGGEDGRRPGRRDGCRICPERIAEGRAMTELFELPQLISSRTPRACSRPPRRSACRPRACGHEPQEAELAKLFTNVWRYIKFATANQLYMMANEQGLDFERIRPWRDPGLPEGRRHAGGRVRAGPCLLKDTMQLAAFNQNNFALGHAAMAINEGIPLYLVHCLERRYDLAAMTVAVLGMAFKGGSDDTRSSLSYKSADPGVQGGGRSVHRPVRQHRPGPRPLDEVLAQSDLLVIAAPHPITATCGPTSQWPTSGTSRSGGAAMKLAAPGCRSILPAYNEGDAIMSSSTGCLSWSGCPCEVLVVVDDARTRTFPCGRGLRSAKSRGSAA